MSAKSKLVVFEFLLLFLIDVTHGIVPEASQEGTLHSFKNYADVAMFHYTVPKEVLHATWQFAAFMDSDKCPSRKVHIYLQQGSYPIISVNNATFPPNTNWKRNGTFVVAMKTSFETTTTVVPIYSPEPGDWFVGAYLSYWDERVQQQGLSHKCRYSFGSVGIWSQTSDIQSIPLGFQMTMRTRDTISYYKIYIPSGTWQFRVDVWACKFILMKPKHNHDFCIKSLALAGRVLPVYNHSNTNTIKLATSDFHTFTEFSPFEDSYYYLMVVSDSITDFNIKVTVTECTVRVMENPIIDSPNFSKAIVQLNVKDLGKERYLGYSNGSLDLENELTISKGYDVNKETIGGDKCIPRYQLSRVKHAQTFSGIYLLQGREWLKPWLTLTDSYPIVTQFNILPLVDIGGTLEISVSLEVDRMMTKQMVGVSICIQQGRVPGRIDGQIICNDKDMAIHLSSYTKRQESILIPYPQPDTWHVSLQAKCYRKETPVRCEMEEILMSLHVKLRPCVFAGRQPCGEFGVCQQIHRGLLYYSTCSCFRGHKGWGCNDSTSANPQTVVMLNTWLLTLSNLSFLPAIYLTMKRKLYTEGLVYFTTMLFSSLYHACDQQFSTHCITKFEVLQYCDFFSSILAFWVTLVAMAEVPLQFTALCHMFGVFIIAFIVEYDKTALSSILIPLAIGIFLPMGSYVRSCYKAKRFRWPNRILKISVGISFAILGVLLFSLIETEANYQYVHSAWHVIISMSLLFLLPPSRDEKSFDDETISQLVAHNDSQNSPTILVS